MKSLTLIIIILLAQCSSRLLAYEITGAKPISKLEDQQMKAKADKKLITIVYQGSDKECPHCAAAAENGIKAVHNSSVILVITQKEAHDVSLIKKLPASVKNALKDQFLGAWVSFTVFDPDFKKVIASANRDSLEDDVKATRTFANKVREARKELK